ncbi:pyrimidine dimer DNA glycosylase /DNA-(apurinic or apyrimidinic site) lyase [Candidatus Magnetomorum sp. HK-1]|nr:pyrimidine dimer DNA glycosylase /DNA-(apurinic or apyrimidinic site) lyase [Candidatus Magnetomorum sp. HK-1]
MRLWSIHPEYLDSRGLVALWRETLLAKKVLQNKTRGYKNHPQLARFKNEINPILAINYYLKEIYNESLKRNYNFDKMKIGNKFYTRKINVTAGQIQYEFKHLLNKLKKRDFSRYESLERLENIKINSLFTEIPGSVETWEKI